MTRNITLAVDEAVFDQARIIAAQRKTTVNGLVRDYLSALAEKKNDHARARRRLKTLIERSSLEVGPVTWKREDLYGR